MLMPLPTPPPLSSLYRWLALAGTAAYATGLLWGMHWPRLPLPFSAGFCAHSDKGMHFVFFMGLGVLATVTAVLWKQATPLKIAILVAAMTAAAAMSEMTQPLTKRNAEFLDWIASTAGAGAGTMLVVGMRRKAK